MRRASNQHNGGAGWLMPLLGISAAFVVGRIIARMRQDGLEEKTLRLELAEEQKPLTMPSPSSALLIEAEPAVVYQLARQLTYFNRFLFGVDKVEVLNPTSARLTVTEGEQRFDIDLEIIAEQPGEFFGMRIEYRGELYGTCLVHFEPAPANLNATLVTVQTRYKVRLPAPVMGFVQTLVAREIDVYLAHLKEHCEIVSVG